MVQRCIFAVLFAAVIAAGQTDTGEIRGQVVSSRDKEPLSLVQVQLRLAGATADTSAGTPFRAITGQDGTFSIPGVPPGNYVLQLEPEVELYRDNAFLKRVGEVARSKNFAVVSSDFSSARRPLGRRL